jgi:aminoglycoside phosphotransferase (APT) family kinase protein
MRLQTVLKTATNTRTDMGLVDEVTLAKLFERLPRLRAIDREALRHFAAQALGVTASDIRLRGIRELSTEGSKGFSGAPVYFVFDQTDSKLGVIKLFSWSSGYGPKGFVMELSALERLERESFKTFAVPKLLGVAKALEGKVGVLATKVALGQPFDDLMFAVRDARYAPAREKACQELLQAVAANGKTLAELHTKPAGSGGQVTPQQLAKHLAVIQGSLDFIQACAQEKGIRLELSELQTAINDLILHFKDNPGGSALIHGDPNPGNLLYHPKNGMTLIDVSSLHTSIDADGNPIGCPAADLARFDKALSRYGELSNKEVAQLRATFRHAYQAAGGAQITPSAYAFFYVQSMLGDLITAVLKEEPLLEEIDKQLDQIRKKLGLQL